MIEQGASCDACALFFSDEPYFELNALPHQLPLRLPSPVAGSAGVISLPSAL
jgi:hypothetical protein